MIPRVLVLGGTRSGKSAYAEALLDADAPALYVATARGVDPAVDPEWADRVEVHRARRPTPWRTVEDVDVTAVLAGAPADPVLVDDLATWVTGLLDDARWERDAPSVAAARADLVAAVAGFAGTLVLVSAEVGLGVVPSTSAGRRFRDELGALNQELAAVCDEVWLLVAGVPLRLR
ncbi:bifunctional adenosylcobinamide kinase/adenosylcobinamide-phosphate guanylyltransferase [Actinomycetospora lutea]|uniref:bifunctional adenosylcobinamide kinase/adenosylcobinamide-phosphate guanylyltransferase n=1 Tax=Actinomycetospora lutea TaxID=663604 RepID=UPI002365FAC5|nr:bifunctional adenosylcobinamide kinase/adenosylcobinamide-phosphate guanylyltransferase [Actinomycetospora lutea]MDD7940488.1 bifunctional adenosylcobinamide kinase/adenosylcobinamide-phosphate guanylyltransferase [Actinomycetospora lutea]